MIEHLLNTLNPAQLLSQAQQSAQSQIARSLALAVTKMADSEPWVATSAAANQDKIIAVSFPLLGQNHRLCWRVDAEQILVAVEADEFFEQANVTLAIQSSIYSHITVPLALPQLMRHVHIAGDAQLAEWVNTLAQRLRPDVWETLAKTIGDVPSSYLQQGFNTVSAQLKSAARSLTQQAQYALLDETPVMIRHATLDAFGTDARELRYAVDRLEQRIARLQSQSS